MSASTVRGFCGAAIVVLSAWTGSGAAQTAPDLEFAFRAEQILRTDGAVVNDVEILTRGVLLEIYQRNAFGPVWSDRERIRAVVDLLGDAADHGLLPADYEIAELERILARAGSGGSAQARAQDDIVVSESLLRYAYQRRHGKVEGGGRDTDFGSRREAFAAWPAVSDIGRALRVSSPADFVALLAPPGPIYAQLQRELERHRDVAAAGGWPSVAAGATLRRDDEDARVAQIRRRLAASGDLPASADTRMRTFDADLRSAVMRFQQRHGLVVDGIVGPRTLEAMNVPVEQRIDQLRLSLERLRWVGESTAEGLVLVNIAGFRVFFFDRNGIKWHARAMVGTEYRQTPVFRGEIAYLEFNPTWTIPPVILREDVLPAVKSNPDYLTSRNIRVIDRDGRYVDPRTIDWSQYRSGVPYTLRQDAGPNNPLGIVKFIFPNDYLVSLHDTPNRELFSHAERTFSSGCIRVENPLTLAELVLDDPAQYSVAALQQIVDSGGTQRIFPRSSVPVVVMYLTASLDPSGDVSFYRDVYDRDQRVLDALNGPVTIDLPYEYAQL